jgi:peptidoglycan hydrolase CwlO-like protein
MRKALAAAVAVALFVTAGCQDQQAREQNAKLQAELDAMKASKASGGDDDLVKLLLADRQGGGDSGDLAKKLNSYNEDVTAGQDKLEKLIKDSDADNDKRMDDIEGRLKRVSDLETTINTLKGMIETLEGKVKSVDPNQVLDAQKELINKEADLRVEKQAKDAALLEIQDLKAKLSAAEAEVQRLNGEVATLLNGDISKHPEYKNLKAEHARLEGEVKKWESDYKSLNDMYKALEERLRNGSNPPEEKPVETVGDYAFSGSVVDVTRGARPEGPSYLLVGSIKAGGQTPPIGTELIVLDAKEKAVCKVKVIQYYYLDDNEDLPVEEIGCSTIDEKVSRPVAKGDTVVWIAEKKTEDAGKEPKVGEAGGD